MKNLKIYKRALALVTSASILLLSGCTSTNTQNTNETKSKQKEEKCTHLTVYFENNPITFKECDGFDIDTRRYGRSSEIEYNITRKKDEIIKGVTTNYHEFFIRHSEIDTFFDDESIKKTR